jgi:hypothetical protein
VYTNWRRRESRKKRRIEGGLEEEQVETIEREQLFVQLQDNVFDIPPLSLIRVIIPCDYIANGLGPPGVPLSYWALALHSF